MRRLPVFLAIGFFSANVALGAVPELAKKHMARGTAALEMAKDRQGYMNAIVEFEAAAKEAPDWADPCYNLGMVYGRIGNYGVAIDQFRKYLRLSPNAQDAGTVQNQIYKLEYRLEEKRKIESLYGWWHGKYKKGKVREFTAALSGDGLTSHLTIWIPKPYMNVEVSGVKIANGKLEADTGKIRNMVCATHFRSLRGSINERGEMNIELVYVTGADCRVPNSESVIRCSLAKGNFIGLNMERKRYTTYAMGKKINQIWSGSPAAKAGLKRGDKLVAMNGKKIKAYFHYQLADLINGFPQGAEITLSVKRKGVKEPLEFKFFRP